jgi:hypothetical protein
VTKKISERRIPCGRTFQVSFALKDQYGVYVPLTDISSLALTFTNEDGTIQAGRNAVNALNANDVVVSALGVVTWSGTSADSAAYTSQPGQVETRRALFVWTYSGGTGQKSITLRFSNTKAYPA